MLQGALKNAEQSGALLSIESTTRTPPEQNAQIKIVLSNRDVARLPLVTGPQKLADLARAAGWFVRVGYAVAEVAERWYLNGNLDRAAHEIQTIMVAMLRPPDLARALWSLCSDWPPTPTGRPAGWRFDHAFVGMHRVTLTQLTERLGAA